MNKRIYKSNNLSPTLLALFFGILCAILINYLLF